MYYPRTRIIIILCRSHNIVILLYARAANITEMDRQSNTIISEIPFDSSYIIIAMGPTDFDAKKIFYFCFSLLGFRQRVSRNFSRPPLFATGKICFSGPHFLRRGKICFGELVFVMGKYVPLLKKKAKIINDHYCNRYVYRLYDWYVNVGRSVQYILVNLILRANNFHSVNESEKSCFSWKRAIGGRRRSIGSIRSILAA